ncbi:MAG TPA: aryl-sulfate sulfotransferase [Candidatus Acidoferrales bacterium]|nr:aryl-sulfate sulfotransferase [Candidatus Acidoferrales bacterium]
MPPKSGWYACALFTVFAIVLLAGCSSSSQPPVTVTLSPSPAFVGSAQTVQLTANVTGDSSGVTWSVAGASGGTIDANGNFTAPAVTQNATATVTATSKRDTTKSATATVNIIAPGTVANTNNPQVAQYTINPPADAKVSIQFGPDTSYGLTTWTQPTPSGGGPTSIYVAGMRANTPYHMRAVMQFSAGATVNDADHTFTTGAIPSANLPSITASTTAGMTPQSGVELLALTTNSTLMTGVVTDLSGNVLWAYNVPGLTTGFGLFPIKLLPNGDFLVNYTIGSKVDGTQSVMQEVDLGGNVVWQMTPTDLNNALASATCTGCNITVVGTHHDVAILPNGHLIVLAGLQKTVAGLAGYSTPQTVNGDAIIDLDQNHKPVWVWNGFDHLDPNRHPLGLPDWTHTNAVVYSPDDGDLIVSMRNQSWVIKIDYHDGAGTGNILWKLGYQGDFTLQGGTDPVDWQYAQHDPNVITPNSSGVFQLTLFDDGNNRVLDSSGNICGTTGQPACWTRIPIYQIDETGKTATLEWVDDLSPFFSLWGGSSRQLANGNIEFDECADGANSIIYEVTKTTPPQTAWQMHITGQNAYRGYRIPSLYPGVQW